MMPQNRYDRFIPSDAIDVCHCSQQFLQSRIRLKCRIFCRVNFSFRLNFHGATHMSCCISFHRLVVMVGLFLATGTVTAQDNLPSILSPSDIPRIQPTSPEPTNYPGVARFTSDPVPMVQTNPQQQTMRAPVPSAVGHGGYAVAPPAYAVPAPQVMTFRVPVAPPTVVYQPVVPVAPSTQTVTAYYAPVSAAPMLPPAVAPATLPALPPTAPGGRPIMARTKYYVPGQPVRNMLKAITP